MESYIVHTQQGNIIINQINCDEAIIWHVPLCPNGLKLNGDDMEKLAKAMFKMSRKLKSNNLTTIPQQPVSIPMNMQNPSMPPPATPNRMEMTKNIHQRAYAPWTHEEKIRWYNYSNKVLASLKSPVFFIVMKVELLAA